MIALLRQLQTCMKPLKRILGLKAFVIRGAILLVALEAPNAPTCIPRLPHKGAEEKGRGTPISRVKILAPISQGVRIKVDPKGNLRRTARIRLPAKQPTVASTRRGIVLTKRTAASCTVVYLPRMRKSSIILNPIPL